MLTGKIVVAAFFAGLFGFGDATPREVSNVRYTLELHFTEAKPHWEFVECQVEMIEARFFTYCHPAGNKGFGGLFLIESDGTAIYPINGKAMQYAEKMDLPIFDPKQAPPDILDWTGPLFDIPAILVHFQ